MLIHFTSVRFSDSGLFHSDQSYLSRATYWLTYEWYLSIFVFIQLFDQTELVFEVILLKKIELWLV